jgi:hypothetical protein
MEGSPHNLVEHEPMLYNKGVISIKWERLVDLMIIDLNGDGQVIETSPNSCFSGISGRFSLPIAT